MGVVGGNLIPRTLAVRIAQPGWPRADGLTVDENDWLTFDEVGAGDCHPACAGQKRKCFWGKVPQGVGCIQDRWEHSLLPRGGWVTRKKKERSPRGSAAFRIARNTGYCQGADDSYIGLHRVSVNPIPQAYPSRITQLDWRSCVAGETSGVAGVGWMDDTGVTWEGWRQSGAGTRGLAGRKFDQWG